MSRPKIGRHHAVFPPGYVGRSLIQRLVVFLGRWSGARLRAFVFGLPHSRLRTYVVAHYTHWMYRELSARRLNRILDLVAEDGEWVIGQLETYRGRKGLADFWRAIDESFPGVQLELREYIDAGNGNFVCIHSFEGEGVTSGKTAGRLSGGYPVQCTFTVRDGRIVRCRVFTRRSEALEAAGLSEGDAHSPVS